MAGHKVPTCRTAGHISAMWLLGSLRRAAVSPGWAQGHSFQLCGVVRVHSLICTPRNACSLSLLMLMVLGLHASTLLTDFSSCRDLVLLLGFGTRRATAPACPSPCRALS